MAAPTTGVWGIDVGQCGVKALRLQNVDGDLTATAFDYIEYPKILTQPDADPDQLIREALEQFLSRNTLRGDIVVIAVPGQSGLARFVKLPPVEEKKIADIVRFEAKQQIPFPLEEVVWDYQKLGSGEVNEGFAMGTEIGLFALKRDMVFRYLQHFKDVGVEVQIVQMAPLALCNFVAFDLITAEKEKSAAIMAKGAKGKAVAGKKGAGRNGVATKEAARKLSQDEDDEEDDGKKKCIVALDIGTDNSNLVITDGDRIIWQRPIPLGGNHFTRSLTKDMKLTFAKAEHLKRNAVKSPDLRKILSSLKTVLNDFVGEVQRSLGYFTNTHRDAKVQYMIGLGNAFRLPGLQKYLQEKLSLEVRKFNHLARVEGDEVTSAPTFVENLPSFAVAYGLALQGMNQTRLTTNLLPYEVHMERLVRGKKPWAVASAACLMLAVGMFLFTLALANASFAGPDVEPAIKALDAAIAERNKLKQDYDTAEKGLNKTRAEIKSLVGGVDERFNWQLLHQYINLALPQPNGTRLVEESMDRFHPKNKYGGDKATLAFQKLEASRFSDKKNLDLKKAEELDLFIKSNLVQINVISIDQRFADDLQPFYKRLIGAGEVPGINSDELQKLREQKGAGFPKEGWIIEIRGYTYHWDTVKFVERTFVENLHRFKGKFNETTKEWEDVIVENKAILDKQFQKGSPDTLRKIMTERVENKKHLLHIYKLQDFPDPVPGVYQLINQTYLPELLKGEAAAGGQQGGQPGPGGGPKAGPQGKDAGKDKDAGAAAKDRSKWTSVSKAGKEFAKGGGQGGGRTGLKRTEFVVVVLWDEPYLGQGENLQPAPQQQPAATPAAGAAPGAGGPGAAGGIAMPTPGGTPGGAASPNKTK